MVAHTMIGRTVGAPKVGYAASRSPTSACTTFTAVDNIRLYEADRSAAARGVDTTDIVIAGVDARAPRSVRGFSR